MEPRYRFRLYLLTALILIGFGSLLSRLYQYQITERDHFRKQVPSDYTVTIREPGIRGDITDRHGRLLAKNLRNYEVVFNLDEIRNDYKRYLIEGQGNFGNIFTGDPPAAARGGLNAVRDARYGFQRRTRSEAKPAPA